MHAKIITWHGKHTTTPLAGGWFEPSSTKAGKPPQPLSFGSMENVGGHCLLFLSALIGLLSWCRKNYHLVRKN
jgi:hypothetical protein